MLLDLSKSRCRNMINNLVDTRLFLRDNSTPILRKEYLIDDSVLAFGIVARLSPEKRHIDFIAAAKKVHKKFQNTVFFIIGEGPEKKTIELLTKDESYIYMVGARRDVPNVLRSLDCFVLPSKVESLPLSIREAMSMELPVIATDVGGNREIVVEGITGYLVKPCCIDELYIAMIKILKEDGKRKQMGLEGRKYCQIRFDSKNWAVNTERKFLSLLKG